mmetsp:Transcript_29052/g.90551  ORF Transcript_29052/g.90551 Transcript_29052/m.90551 type:complete len:314 (-) Transcript_29052:414-1355(-)
MALLNGLPHSRARRIPQRDPAEERQFRGREVRLFQVEGEISSVLGLRQDRAAEAEDALAPGRSLFDGAQGRRSHIVHQRLGDARGCDKCAATVEHPLRGALQEQQPVTLARQLVDGEHVLVRAVEGQLCKLRVLPTHGLRFGRGTGGGRLAVVPEEPRVRGIADDLVVGATDCAVAEHHGSEELLVRRGIGGMREFRDSHPVLRESACLVRCDDAHGAQGLHDAEILHQDVAPGHVGSDERQGHRHSHGHALGHECHNQRDAVYDLGVQGEEVWVLDPEPGEPPEKGDNPGAQGEHGNDDDEAVDLLVERRWL